MSFFRTDKKIIAKIKYGIIFDEFEVHQCLNSSRGYVNLGLIYFPAEYIGKRIKFKIEVEER